jgi:glyoxylate reductase
MTQSILVAAELRELLDADPVPGCRIEWLDVASATPAGPHVAIVPLLSRRIGEAELALLPRLRVVANCAVGFDNVDLAACARRGVVVTNTPDVLTDATADLTLALILAVARRLGEGQRLIERGAWQGWDPRLLLGLELQNATLGIVGAGRIGRAVARRAVAFGMRLYYTDSSARSDVVTLHLPSTPETRGLIGRRELAGIRRGAILINTARGDILDEPALVEALEDGRLGGVGLDVFAREPEVPAALAYHPRAVVLPHLGSATTHTRRAMAALAVRNVRAVLAGEPPVTPVGPR